MSRLEMPPRVFRTATSGRDRPSRSPIPSSSAAFEVKVTPTAGSALPKAPNIGR